MDAADHEPDAGTRCMSREKTEGGLTLGPPEAPMVRIWKK